MFLVNKTNNFTKISHSAQINWDHYMHFISFVFNPEFCSWKCFTMSSKNFDNN